MNLSRPALPCALLTLVSLVPLPAATVYDGGGPDGVTGYRLSDFVELQQFTITTDTTLRGLIFIGAADIDDVPSQFSGTIGFRLLADNAGAPGSSLAVGSDSGVQLIDNGTLNTGTAEYRFLVNLGSIPLAAGTYWLALHEGAMGTPFDGTTIYWDTTSSAPGGTADARSTLDLTGLSGYSPSGVRLAFQLLDTPAYESVPEPSTWALMLGATGLLLGRRFRRN